MLYNIEFQLAILEVLTELNSKEKRFFSVREIAEKYFIVYPSDLNLCFNNTKYKQTTFRRRVKMALMRFNSIKKVEKKLSKHPINKQDFYLFKLK